MNYFKNYNKGYRYILIIIDTYSRQTFLRAIKDKTARTKLYKEIKPFLPHITDSNLCKKTQRARKFLKCLEKEE